MLKNIITFLTSKIFLIALIIIILIVLSVLFWIYGSLIAFNDIYIFSNNYIRALIIFAVWLALFLIFVLKHLIDFIKNHKNTKKEQLKSIKEESNSLYFRMKRNFNLSLKDAKITWRSTSLKKLPLIIILGNEGSGKSTIINYSNIEYPLSDSLESYKKFHQSTKNFGLYVSKNGALIDTEGQYFSQEMLFNPKNSDELPEDDLEGNKDFLIKKSSWSRFLSFLNKKRFYHKLSGILLVIDSQRFLQEPLEYTNDLVRYLVKRTSECEKSLNMKLPIYIVFTKIDLIEGMGELLKIFGKDVADCPLGITLKDGFSEDSLRKDFSEIAQSLLSVLISKNSIIHNLEDKNRAYLFIKQLENLFSLAISFTLKAKAENELKNKSFIRGVYFASAYQENAPKNYLLNAVCEKFDIKKPASKTYTKYVKQSYFVKSLFLDIIFKDFVAKSLLLRNFIKPIILAAFMIIVLWISIIVAKYYLNQANDAKDKAKYNIAHLEQILDSNKNIQLLNIKDKIALAQDIKSIIAPFPSLFEKKSMLEYIPLNISYKAYIPIKELYFDIINDLLKDTLLEELELVLSTSSDEIRIIRALYVYQSLFDEKFLNKDLIRIWVQNNWALFDKYSIPQNEFMSCIELIDAFSNTQKKDEIISLALSKINNATKAKKIYALLEFIDNNYETYNIKEDVGLSFNDVFESNSNFVFNAIYTKNGVEKFINNLKLNINKAINIESWLFDDQTNIDKNAIMLNVIKLYLQEYQDKWQTMLNAISPKKFSTKENGLNELLILSKKDNPMQSFIKAVSINTKLDDILLLNQAINLGLPSLETKNLFTSISNTFAPYHKIADEDSMIASKLNVISQKVGLESNAENTKTMDLINSGIGAIYSKINDFLTSNDTPEAKINYALNTQKPQDDPFIAFKKDLSILPNEMRKYYQALGDYAWLVVESSVVTQLNIAWSKEIWEPFMNEMAPYYPFNPNSKEDIKMDNFKNFFGKQGIWNKFYEKYLKEILLKKQNAYSIQTNHTSNLNLSNEFLNTIANIATLSNLMFDNNNNLQLNYSITSANLSGDFNNIRFGYDENFVQYDHTFNVKLNITANYFNDSSTLEFIATGQNKTSKFNNNFYGEWAWLKLLNSLKKDKNRYMMYFNDNEKLYFDMEIKSNSNIWRVVEILRSFNIPTNISK